MLLGMWQLLDIYRLVEGEFDPTTVLRDVVQGTCMVVYSRVIAKCFLSLSNGPNSIISLNWCGPKNGHFLAREWTMCLKFVNLFQVQ